MKIFKYLIVGYFGGGAYAFISFYLITPQLHGNWPVILFWGLQGAAFAAIYLILNKYLLKGKKDNVFACVTNGGISGLLSSICPITITYYNAIFSVEKTGTIVLQELRDDVISQLTNYGIGCMFLGIMVGILIYRKNTNYKAAT